jgi:hypothetical protein
MSVYRYDNAIVECFRDIFEDSRIHILPPEQAIRFTGQLRQDNIEFPLISTYRLGYSIKNNDVNFYGLHQGGFQNRGSNGINTFAQVVPIRINYQIDIFTVDKRTGDEITRELILFLFQNPTLKVDIPYQLDIKHKFNLFLESDVVDNSDTVEHVNKGVLFRNTLTMYTDDAYLFASRQELHGNVTGTVITDDE